MYYYFLVSSLDPSFTLADVEACKVAFAKVLILKFALSPLLVIYTMLCSSEFCYKAKHWIAAPRIS